MRENQSLLFTELLCRFNKNESIFNLYSEDYAIIFYIWLFGFCTWTRTNFLFVSFFYLFICTINTFSNRAKKYNLHRALQTPATAL